MSHDSRQLCVAGANLPVCQLLRHSCRGSVFYTGGLRGFCRVRKGQNRLSDLVCPSFPVSGSAGGKRDPDYLRSALRHGGGASSLSFLQRTQEKERGFYDQSVGGSPVFLQCAGNTRPCFHRTGIFQKHKAWASEAVYRGASGYGEGGGIYQHRPGGKALSGNSASGGRFYSGRDFCPNAPKGEDPGGGMDLSDPLQFSGADGADCGVYHDRQLGEILFYSDFCHGLCGGASVSA